MSTGSAREDGTALLTLSEVAAIFGVEPATVARWARAGKLTFIPGQRDNGERYFAESQVRALIHGDGRRPSGPALEAAQALRTHADPLGVELETELS